MACECPPDQSSLLTDAMLAKMCTACGLLACTRCTKRRRCCRTPTLVAAGPTVVRTIGTSIIACPRGCVGGTKHSAKNCKRPRAKSAKRVRKSHAWITIRPGKRIKREEVTKNVAEIWEVKTTLESGADGENWSVLVGPAIPGSTVGPAVGQTPVKKIKVAAVNRTKVAKYGCGWIPRQSSPFAGLSTETWKKVASSTCAWSRIIERAGPSQAGKTAVAVKHDTLKAPPQNAPLQHNPPLHRPHPRLKSFVTCGYCQKNFNSKDAYIDECAPDAVRYK